MNESQPNTHQPPTKKKLPIQVLNPIYPSNQTTKSADR